jgi:hypothetical protein
MGWTVEGAFLMPEMSVSTESVGMMPCNALSVPKEAAVIAKTCNVTLGCVELKADAPAVGWATGRVCTTQILPLLLETEGVMLCEAEDVKDDDSKPSGYTGIFGVSMYSGPGSHDATKAVMHGAADVDGLWADLAQHGDVQDVPLDVPRSFADKGDMVQGIPLDIGLIPPLWSINTVADLAYNLPGPGRPLSIGQMPCDVAQYMPERLGKELAYGAGSMAKNWAWNEWSESLSHSEGEKKAGAAGGTHATRAGVRCQHSDLRCEPTHPVYPRCLLARCRRPRQCCHFRLPGRPPMPNVNGPTILTLWARLDDTIRMPMSARLSQVKPEA